MARSADKDRKTIAAFLKQHPEGATSRQVADDLGVSINTANARLAVMRTRGAVEFVPHVSAFWRSR